MGQFLTIFFHCGLKKQLKKLHKVIIIFILRPGLHLDSRFLGSCLSCGICCDKQTPTTYEDRNMRKLHRIFSFKKKI